MRLQLALLLVAVLSAPACCAAQDSPAAAATDAPETTVTEPAAAIIKAPASAAPREKGFYGEGWKQFGPNLARDQKSIWLFPVSLAQGKHLKPTIALVGVTAALISLDKYSAGYFYRTNSFDEFNQAFSGPNTALAMEVIPAGLYAIGLARRDKYAQETFVLAARAVLDAEILTVVMKDIDRRSIPENGDFSDTWFNKTDGSYLRGVGSFPSGHTIAAFALATAYARRYPNPKWHQWVAYGLAGLVGFSRVSIHAHYPSDVFVGAALGYVITRYVVLRLQ